MTPGRRLPAQISSDGRTVWVNDQHINLGRFSARGIDVHATAAAQVAGGGHCLMCRPGPATASDWRDFKDAMLKHHGVRISEEFRPEFLDNVPVAQPDRAAAS